MRTEISRPTIGSTIGEPPARTTAPATTTPSEPSASAALWRRTPSRLRSCALAAGEDQRRGEVAGEAERAERQHAGAVDRRRVAEPADRGDGDPDPDRDQQQPVGQRRQHLRALVAEGAAAAGRAGGEARGGEGEDDRADVGEQVPGVGEDRQGAGEDAADRLDREQPDVDRQRDPHAAAAVAAPAPRGRAYGRARSRD